MSTIKYNLPTKTFAAGGTDVINLKDLPAEYQGRIPHLLGITFGITMTPTYTTAPTIFGQNRVANAVDFTDGSVLRFQGGFNHMRMKEKLSFGRNRLPEADTNTASATARYWRRHLDIGPCHLKGGLSDFAYPVAALEQGELRISWGALTDISADTTAATGTVRAVAHLALFDEIRLPPAYVFRNYSATGADITLSGRALYVDLSALDSASMGNFAAGEMSAISLDLGYGDVVRAIQAEDLAACYQADFAPGEIGAFQGEPEAASDDNAKQVDHASPTALAAGPLDLQPILWAAPGTKLTKLFEAGSAARLTWTGSQSTAVVLAGQILHQSDPVLGAIATRALKRLGKPPKGAYPKTLSKKPYTGPLKGYMPHVVKF